MNYSEDVSQLERQEEDLWAKVQELEWIVSKSIGENPQVLREDIQNHVCATCKVRGGHSLFTPRKDLRRSTSNYRSGIKCLR